MKRGFPYYFLILPVLLSSCNTIDISVPLDASGGGGGTVIVPTPTPSALPAVAAHSTLVVGSGTADNSTPIVVTITLKDTNSDPVVGTVPTIEIFNSAGAYAVTTPCTYSDTSGTSTCAYKTYRGGQQIVRMTSPAALTSVGAVANPACASAGTFFSGAQGSGTSIDPYQISSFAQFDQIRCLSSYFKLTADLDMTGKAWFPAQVDLSPAINGQNHVISNLTIDIDYSVLDAYGMTSGVGAGLLGSNAYDGTAVREIKNITFTHPSVYGRGALATQGIDAGLIAAKTNHQISYITVTNGIVQGSGAVGGIVGYLGSAQVGSGHSTQEALVEHCSFSGDTAYLASAAVTGGNHLTGVAGLVGRVGRAGGSVSYNTFTGTVDAYTEGGNDAGGMVGDYQIEDNNTGEKIAINSNQVTNSTINSRYFSGGIDGNFGAYANFRQTAQPTISGNFVSNTTVDSGSNAGGLAGGISEHYGGSHLNLFPIIEQNAVLGGSIHAGSALGGGLIGFMGIGSIRDSYVQGTVINASGGYYGGLVGGVTLSDPAATSIVCEIVRSYSAVSFISLNYSYSAVLGRRTDSTLNMDLSSGDVYYDADVAGSVTETAPLLANGYTTANMKTATPFAGWSTGVWDFQAGHYPRLISNANP